MMALDYVDLSLVHHSDILLSVSVSFSAGFVNPSGSVKSLLGIRVLTIPMAFSTPVPSPVQKMAAFFPVRS